MVVEHPLRQVRTGEEGGGGGQRASPVEEARLFQPLHSHLQNQLVLRWLCPCHSAPVRADVMPGREEGASPCLSDGSIIHL